MAAETELERMVVRLMGDGRDYAAVLQDAIRATEAAVRKIESSASESRAQNQALAEAAAITRAVELPLTRYNRQLENLREHLRAGRIDQETFNRAARQARQELAAAEAAVYDYGAKIQSLGVSLTVAGGAVTSFFGGMLGFALRSQGQFEQTTIAFETMLGSASEAKALLEDLTEFAALTPFEMPEIEAAARGLVQFGERGEQLMDTLNALGNAAAGTSTDFGMVALIFNQIRGVGKLLTQDFRQLSTRGILSLQDLADHFGVTLEKAQEMLSGGEITFEAVRDIFRKLSSEGGRFANLMERQSESLLGRIATLKDAFNIALREIGADFAPMAKDVVEAVIGIIEGFRELNDDSKKLIVTVAAVAGGLGVVLTVGGTTIIVIGRLVLAYRTVTAAIINHTLSVNANTASVGANTKALTAQAAALGRTRIAALGARSGMLALTAAVGYAVTSAYYKNSAAVEEFNRLLEEQGKLREREARLASKPFAGVAQEAASMPVDTARDFLTQKLAEAKKQQEGLNFAVKAAKEDLQNYNTLWNKLLEKWHGHGGLQLARQEFENAKTSLEEFNKVVEELEEALGKLPSPDKTAPSEEAIEKSIQLRKELEKQIAVFGKSALEAKLYELELEKIPPAELEITRALGRQLEMMEREKKAQEDARKAQEEYIASVRDGVASLTRGLFEQVATFGMTSDEIAIWRLRMRGASDEVLGMARALIHQKNVLEEHKKAMEEGKQITEQYLTPQERFVARYKELANLWEAGAISTETFNRAIEDARRVLAEADLTAEVRFETRGIEGIRAGSAEAAAALAEHQRRMREDRAAAVVPRALATQAERERRAERGALNNTRERDYDKDRTTLFTLLGRIADAFEASAKREGVELEPLNLEG